MSAIYSLFYGAPLVVLAIQVFFAVHAIRHGKGGWVFLIVFFPLVGSLIYLVVEFLPELRARGSVSGAARRVKERINPAAEIQRLEDQVALSNSLVNRMALARGYLRVGRAEEAITLYQQSLVGLYADDPQLLSELAHACHATGRLAEARETFERLRASTSLLSTEQLLLSALIHEDAGEAEAAAAEYERVLARPVIGEEARCRYALLLRQLGRGSEATALFDAIVRHARLSPAHYRKAEKAWIDIARRELATRESSTV
jgi:hypothetical protein